MTKKRKLKEKEFDHFCEDHLTVRVVTGGKKGGKSLEVSVVAHCDDNPGCPLPPKVYLYFCPSHPCPGKG